MKTESPPSANRMGSFKLPIVLVAVVLATFGNGIWGTFVFDDTPAIVKNDGLQDFWGTVRNLPYSTRPVTEFSIAVNYSTSGASEAGFHAVNIAAHATATCILYELILLTLRLPGTRNWAGSDAMWIAFAVAVLWSVHPLQSQSVTYIIQRAQVFSGTFQLAAIYCLARGASSQRPTYWYISSIAAALLAVGSKQDAIVLPVLALLYDRIYLTEKWRETLSRRWAVHVGLFASWFGLIWSIRFALYGFTGLPTDIVDAETASTAVPTAGFGVGHVSWWQYGLTQCEVIPHYLRIAIWPDRLCFDYFDWEGAKKVQDVFLGLGATLLLLSATVLLLFRRPQIGYLAAWTFVELLPTSSFLPIDDFVVEHRMYSALIGPIALFVIGTWSASRIADERMASRIRLATFTCIALALALVTVENNSRFYNRDKLWLSVLDCRPNNARAAHAMAYSLVQQNRYGEAIPYLERSAKLSPTRSTLGCLADACARSGRRSDAIRLYLAAIDAPSTPARFREYINSTIPVEQLHFNLAKLLDAAGDTNSSIHHYREAIRLDPSAIEARINLGTIFAQNGDWANAYNELLEAVRLDSKSAIALNNLAIVASRMGRHDEALTRLSESVRYNPDDSRSYDNWGSMLVRIGRPRDAVPIYGAGLSKSRDDARLAFGLAHALSASGESNAARKAYGEANRTGRNWLFAAAGSAWSSATRPKSGSDPAEAVRLAEIVVGGTEELDCEPLDILAAAYANCGKFPEAMATLDKALSRSSQIPPDRLAAMKQRRKLYSTGKAYIDPIYK